MYSKLPKQQLFFYEMKLTETMPGMAKMCIQNRSSIIYVVDENDQNTSHQNHILNKKKKR